MKLLALMTIGCSLAFCGESGLAAEGAAEPAIPAQITLQVEGYGWLLADTKGMTLYTYTKDLAGKPPACDGACAKTWAAVVAPADATAAGEWSLVRRSDGAQQWAFRGKPLYTYSRDAAPGDTNGDDLQHQWFVAVKYIATPPGFSVEKTENGHQLVDPKGMALYTSAADSNGKSKCAGKCARTWQPAEAWLMASSTDKDWSVVQRDDGTSQWAYKGKPLYRYAGDFAPTEIAGEHVDGYSVVVLQPPPPNPTWVTYHGSDGGELLCDHDGKTLYALDLSRPVPFSIGFGKPMETEHLWKPVVATADDKPIGLWSIVSREDGTRQWTYKGMPLYTNIRDKDSGDLNGVRFMEWFWRTIMKNGQTLPGSGL